MLKKFNRREFADYLDPVYVTLVVTIILTAFVYRNLFFAEFLYYDDTGNVVQNSNIKNITLQNVLSIIKKPVYYSYNPVTFFAYVGEYQLFGLNPAGFHVVNILLHLANIILVFKFTHLITKNKLIAIVTAILFALHPLHTDVVGWISAQNYLLCTLFSLLSLIYYLGYLKKPNGNYIKVAISLVFFILACLSKSQAVTIVILIFLINWITNLKYNFHHWVITGIYICIAIVVGLTTIYFRSDISKTEIIPDYSISDKVIVICFSLVKYLWKLLIPVNLTAIDPFPAKSSGGWLSFWVYISPLLIIGAVFFLGKTKKIPPIYWMGIIFFIVNVFITQITFLEDGFSANRYIYLPSIGLYIIISLLLIIVYEKISRYRYLTYAGAGLLLVMLAWNTSDRSGEYDNTLSLSSSIIEKAPGVVMAYNIRGIWYYNQKDYPLSIEDFNQAISLCSNYSSAYYNRGLSMTAMQNHNAALKDYDRAINLNQNFVSAYLARGIAMLDVYKNYTKAIDDFNKALSLKPDYPQAYYNLGLTYFRMQDLEKACKNWSEVRKMGYSQADGMIAKYCR